MSDMGSVPASTLATMTSAEMLSILKCAGKFIIAIQKEVIMLNPTKTALWMSSFFVQTR
jgi:hypothetical protein